MIGLTCPLGEVFDLVVLDTDLLAQKLVLALQPFDILCRDLSRHVGACRRAACGVPQGDEGVTRYDEGITNGRCPAFLTGRM